MALPLHVLMLSPEPSVPGGVVVFAELLKKYYTRCKVTPFWVGSSPLRPENAFSRAARLLIAPIRLWQQLRRTTVDIVHLNPSLNRNALLRDGLLLLTLKLMRFPCVIVYFHGWHKEAETFLQRSFVCRHLLVWLLGTAQRIIVLSPDFERSLVALGVKPECILQGRTLYDGEPLLKARNLPPYTERRSILFMSRFVREKGVYELLEGFAQIADAFPDVDLIFAGDGEEDVTLKQRAATLGISVRVLFAGYVSGELKSRLLAHCTLFALPTYFPEGMPIALLEALGAGKPILTAKAGVIPYMLCTPDNGIVLDEVTPKTIADALRLMLADPAYCTNVGAHNAVYGAQTFEARSVARDMETLYHTLLCR